MDWIDTDTHLPPFLFQLPFSKQLWNSNSFPLGRQILSVLR